MNVRRSVALVAIAALSLAACGDDDDGPTADDDHRAVGVERQHADSTAVDSTAASTTTEAATTTTMDLATALAGRTFVSTAVEGYQLVDGTEIALTFDGSNIGAAGGCNQMGSTWSLEGAVLVVPELAMTAMACEPAALMDQDTWLAAVLTSRPTVALDGDTLTLTAEGTLVTLVDRETADPDRPLEGTTWNLEGVVAGDPSRRSRPVPGHPRCASKAVSSPSTRGATQAPAATPSLARTSRSGRSPRPVGPASTMPPPTWSKRCSPS